MGKQTSVSTILLFVGGVCLTALAGYFLLGENGEAKATLAFGMGLLLFVFSNLSRFKRFKGLGFEAELWEEKQEEAASLVERLKSLVEIYTSELVLTRVEQNRYGSSNTWRDHWAFLTNSQRSMKLLVKKLISQT